MLNANAPWRVVSLACIVVLGTIYALPNLYGEAPFLTINASSNSTSFSSKHLQTLQFILTQNGLQAISLQQKADRMTIGFSDIDAQLCAKRLLAKHYPAPTYQITAILKPSVPNWLQRIHAFPVKLGLDLRGGVHLLLQVEMMNALINEMYRFSHLMRNDLAAEHEVVIQPDKLGTCILLRAPAKHLPLIKQRLQARYPELLIHRTTTHQLRLIFSDTYRKNLENQLINQNVECLRNRLNQLGIADSIVQREGKQRIVIELPGVQDLARAKEMVGSTTRIEFRQVVSAKEATQPTSLKKMDYNGHAIYLARETMVTGSHIMDARASRDQNGEAQINITLTDEGAEQLAGLSRAHIGRAVAVVFTEYQSIDANTSPPPVRLKTQSTILHIARIKAPLGRCFRITKMSSVKQAKTLALLLRTCTLSAPVRLLEERVIGPTLGRQNIKQALHACVWALIWTAGFMLAYYKSFGLIAISALFVNVVLILSLLGILPYTTLTMPGIAGMLLTICIAIDANVLIFERIKEELKEGKHLPEAIQDGYSNAFSSIVDANVTTLLIALILYTAGIGPIKNFSITLVIGLATSMFTAIVGTRALVNIFYGKQIHPTRLTL